MRTLISRPFVLLFLTTFFVLRVAADKPSTPCNYIELSGDQQSVFVMLAPEAERECLSQGEPRKSEAVLLRKKYGRSGLYRIDDPRNPLWTVEWYAYGVFLSQDGKYLVRQGPWASNENDEAVSFFSDGVLLRSYKVKEIVRSVPDLPHSVSHFQWVKNWKLNAANNTLEIETMENQQILFDITNGGILSDRQASNRSIENSKDEFGVKSFLYENMFFLLGGAVVILATFGTILIVVVRKFHSRKT